MKKNLQTLVDHESERLAYWTAIDSYPLRNAILCPTPGCREELFDSEIAILYTNPPTRKIECERCGFKGIRIL